MYDIDDDIGAEFTVIQSECGAWLLMVKPDVEINYVKFLDGVRSFLMRETGMDDSLPESDKEIN